MTNVPKTSQIDTGPLNFRLKLQLELSKSPLFQISLLQHLPKKKVLLSGHTHEIKQHIVSQLLGLIYLISHNLNRKSISPVSFQLITCRKLKTMCVIINKILPQSTYLNHQTSTRRTNYFLWISEPTRGSETPRFPHEQQHYVIEMSNSRAVNEMWKTLNSMTNVLNLLLFI